MRSVVGLIIKNAVIYTMAGEIIKNGYIEFDKKIIPSYGSNGINNNRAVQHQILTIIEGIRISDNNADIVLYLGHFIRIQNISKRLLTQYNVLYLCYLIYIQYGG